MNEHKKATWRAFFTYEQLFFEFIKANCDCLYSIENCEPEYFEYKTKLNSVIEKPPRYVRWVGRLHDEEARFLQAKDKLERSYKAALGKSFKRFPARFPSFYSSVEQINVIVNEAYQSRPLENVGDVYLKESSGDDESDIKESFEDDVKALKAIGLTDAEYKIIERKSLQGSTYNVSTVAVPARQFFSYAECENIQMRRLTGNQYRARLRHKGDSKGERVNLGFVILDKDSDCLVVESLPQAPRPHSLEATHAEIELPITTSFRFYRK